MRSKTPLMLIELSVMLLVLLVALALCLQAFVWADHTARNNADRDTALAMLQNAAEVLKYCHGDFEAAARLHGGSWDETLWTMEQDGFLLRVIPGTAEGFLGRAELEVSRNGVILHRLQICWQEVGP